MIVDTEEALEAQWSLLGRWPRGELHDEDGLLWFETPIRHLPYNGVIRTRLADDATADAAISRVLDQYRARGVQCVWFVRPSSTPADLGGRLEAQGLQAVEQMTYMSLELGAWEAPTLPPDVAFEEVRDDALMETYSRLTADYWEIPDEDRALVAELHQALGPGRVPAHRFLALIDGAALGKAYLSLVGPPGVASIYGMSVLPEARGRGLARGLTTTLLRRARDEGCHRVVLHSSNMAVDLYERAGFIQHRVLPVYATARIWSGAH